MGFLTLRRGDLFFSRALAVGHGVNIRGAMGAGIAREFRIRYPSMYEEYRMRCLSGDLQAGEMFAWQNPQNKHWVYNLASQDEPGPCARLEWLDSSVRSMVEHASRNGVGLVALPRIGCGIGGLKWPDVERVLSGIARDSTTVQLEVWVA